MARLDFDDKSYVEFRKSEDGNILLLIGARDHENPLRKITNCVEITEAEFKKLVEDVSG